MISRPNLYAIDMAQEHTFGKQACKRARVQEEQFQVKLQVVTVLHSTDYVRLDIGSTAEVVLLPNIIAKLGLKHTSIGPLQHRDVAV